MAIRFQTKIVRRRARFAVTGFSPDAMVRIAQPTRDDIEQRIMRAEDVWDRPAPPLKARIRNGKDVGYAGHKARVAPPAVRNWRFTGRTLRSMKVLRASQNRATIGFADAVANRRAYINNRRWRQFGMSPSNKRALVRAVLREKTVKVVAA